MPLLSSPKPSPVLSQVSYPSYAVKSIGSRHILIGGGGGAGNTGVGNGLELFLLTYNSFPKIGPPSENLRGTKTGEFETEKRSVMNMDCVVLGQLDSGKYLIAAGEDSFCYFYETTGFQLSPVQSEVDVPSQLSFSFKDVGRVMSVDGGPRGYQKVVKFDRSPFKPLRVATGGTDGYVRIWDVVDIYENRDPTIKRKPIVEFIAEASEVNEVDFSPCGTMIVTVTKEVQVWTVQTGKKMAVLPDIQKMPKEKYIGRSAKFVNLNPHSPKSFLAMAHNMRQATTKSNCFLSIWGFDREKKEFVNLELKEIKQERVVVTTVSNCQNYFAVGFATGNVAIFTTRELEQIYFCNAHSNSVTGIEFLPRRTLDTPNMGRIEQNGNQSPQTFLPGVTSEVMVSLVSISMDKVVKTHQVPYPINPEKKRQLSIADENANATPHKNLTTSTPVASKNTVESNTPRTQLRTSKIKTPFKTPLTGVKPTGLFLQPKKLDFDCFEDSDLDGNVELKPDPILEEDEDVENWGPETGDTRPFEVDRVKNLEEDYNEWIGSLETNLIDDAPIKDGTPGIYVRRQSPPRIPSTIAPPAVVSRKSAPPRSRFGSQSSCTSNSGIGTETTSMNFVSTDLPIQQQRTSAARRPVTRSHPNALRELSSHSFSDASKKTEIAILKKSLTSQSIGNITGQKDELNRNCLSDIVEIRNISTSIQSLPEKIPGNSILLENQQDDEIDLPLPQNWAIEVTPNGYRYYVDHNNRRTHWIHPLAPENLPPGWTKIFDENLGVVYYNELEHRSQFEHPGLATPASNIARVHGSVQSIGPYRSHLREDVEDLNIISEEIPVWLQMYSTAETDSDHLLDFNLFKLNQLEDFDEMLLKLFKQDAINTFLIFFTFFVLGLTIAGDVPTTTEATTEAGSTSSGGDCQDYSTDCAPNVGECTNPLFKPLMCGLCKKTCNLCVFSNGTDPCAGVIPATTPPTTPGPGVCVDVDPKCGSDVAQCTDPRFHILMCNYCRKTCNFCYNGTGINPCAGVKDFKYRSFKGKMAILRNHNNFGHP
ncbi:hypothetical protein FO519_002601 [Halicephalobus sp. NKZ332]|nr:hypothetical protein FO519_002601 [Halicephalobus sp. NKZ332]